jgi:hypothetical protein
MPDAAEVGIGLLLSLCHTRTDSVILCAPSLDGSRRFAPVAQNALDQVLGLEGGVVRRSGVVLESQQGFPGAAWRSLTGSRFVEAYPPASVP